MNERRRRSIPFKATAEAAGTLFAVHADDRMAELAARTAEALKELSAQYDSAPDARSERQKNAVRKILSCAELGLAQRRRIGIVENERLLSRVFLHERTERHVPPAEIRPGDDRAVRAVDDPGRTDADRLHVVHALSRFFRRLHGKFRERERRLFGGCIRRSHNARLPFQLRAGEQCCLGGHSAQIDPDNHAFFTCFPYFYRCAAVRAAAQQNRRCPACVP